MRQKCKEVEYLEKLFSYITDDLKSVIICFLLIKMVLLKDITDD